MSQTATSGPIPVCIFTGFLGAGKTTVLQRILTGLEDTEGKVLTLVNDLSPDNTDVLCFQSDIERTPVMALSGGCVCCNLLGDLVAALLQAVESGCAYVVLECTGVADPAPVVATLGALPALAGKIVVDAVITVVHAAVLSAATDAEERLDMSRVDTLCRKQMHGASVVLVNQWETQLSITPSVMWQWAASIRADSAEANLHTRVYFTNAGHFAFHELVHRAGLFQSDAALPYYLRAYAETGKAIGEFGDVAEEAAELEKLELEHFTYTASDLICSVSKLQKAFSTSQGSAVLRDVWRSKGFFTAVDDRMEGGIETAPQPTQFRWQSVQHRFDFGEVLPPHVRLCDATGMRELRCRIVFMGPFSRKGKQLQVNDFFAAIGMHS